MAASRICTSCKITMDAPPWPGERQCDRCSALRQVYIGFQHRAGWQVYFMERDMVTHIGRGRTFADAEKICELIRRTPAKMDSAAWQALDYAMKMGRGGLHLDLTAEQYGRLKL